MISTLPEIALVILLLFIRPFCISPFTLASTLPRGGGFRSRNIMAATSDAAKAFFAQWEDFLGGNTTNGKKNPSTSKNDEDPTKPILDNKADSKRGFLVQVIGKLRQVSFLTFLPTLITFWIGYKVGVSRQPVVQVGGDVCSTSRGVPSLRDTLRTWALVTALMALVVREVWRGIPIWLKRQIPRLILPKLLWTRLVPQQSRRAVVDDSENMTFLPTIIGKLKSLLDLGSEKLGLKDQASTENIETAMLVLLRLVGQIKEYRPDVRDAEFEAYEQDDDVAFVSEYHQRMFEFADAAYDELPDGQELREFLDEQYGYELLRHDSEVVPGSVAHYIALNRTSKDAIIGVKGTSSLEDVLTDCCGVAVDHEGMRCHEGILAASKRLVADLETVLVDLLIPRGYSVTLTGHSLGAGVAALAGILLRKKHSVDLKVLAFASPPILDYQSAANCQSFVTTVVNKADVIPRSSLANLAVLKTILVESIRPKLVEKGIVPSDFQSMKALFQYMTKKSDNEANESKWLMTAEELKGALEMALAKVPIQDNEHLYIPGKVLLMYQLWKNPEKKIAHGVVNMKPTDHALRHLEIDLSMVQDHLAPSYRETLRELTNQSVQEKAVDGSAIAEESRLSGNEIMGNNQDARYEEVQVDD